MCIRDSEQTAQRGVDEMIGDDLIDSTQLIMLKRYADLFGFSVSVDGDQVDTKNIMTNIEKGI